MALSPDPRQTRAIEHLSGPMLVLAGAGTGKTTVLTGRVARLIATGAAQPDEILAITYTDNAAAEMRLKLSANWGVADDVAKRVSIRTFHSYCFEVLRRAGRGFTVVDGTDLWIYLRQRIADLELKRFSVARDPGQFLTDLLKLFEACHDELVAVEDFSNYARQLSPADPLPMIKTAAKEKNIPAAETIERCREIARVYGLVEQMLAAEGFGTYGHMIVGAHRLLASDPALLDAERRRARFILIDEFQDSNAAQIELAELLAGDARNIFAVGDPDQSIYQFRGASGEAFDYFLKRFPDAKTVTLEKNRRSTEPILKCSGTMIAVNPEPASAGFRRQPLVSARAEEAAAKGLPFDQPPVELLMTPKSDAAALDLEALEIARAIREAHDRDGVAWGDFAVLYRTHKHREQVVAELFRQDVPYHVRGVNALDTPEVRDLMALLAVSAGDNGEALLRVAALPRFAVDRAQCRDKLKAGGKSPDVPAVLAKVSGGQQVLADVKAARLEATAAGMRLTSVLIALTRRFGIDRSSAPARALLNFAADWEKKAIVRTGTVQEFLDYMRLFRDTNGVVAMDDNAGGEDRVRLMTVHAAKGLEFDRVFILRANSGSFPLGYHEPLFELPSALRREDSLAGQTSKELHVQEERRLFYVAMTRARDSLTICAKPGIGKDPAPAGYLREFMTNKDVQPFWRQCTATATIDVRAAASAVLPEPTGIAAWLAAPPRESLSDVPLSATSIERYEQCPLCFKIYREWNLPGAPAAQMQFGAAVHTALKGYYDAVRAGRPLSLDALLGCFEEALAAMPAGDEYQRRLYLADGREQLTHFHRVAASAPQPNVIATERDFRIKLGGTTVIGRIDRMDQLAGGRVEIVDYKTGKPRDEEKAKKSLQLSIYGLAAEKHFGVEVGCLTFYNVATNEAVTTTRTKDELAEAEDRIAAVAQNVAAGRFEPTPGHHCTWCVYRELCPATEQRLYSIRGVGAGVN